MSRLYWTSVPPLDIYSPYRGTTVDVLVYQHGNPLYPIESVLLYAPTVAEVEEAGRNLVELAEIKEGVDT